MKQQPPVKYLKNYEEPNYLVTSVELNFDLRNDIIECTSVVKYTSNPKRAQRPLILDGVAPLRQILIDGEEVHNYQLQDEQLILNNLPVSFELTITTSIDAHNNHSCMGLFASNGNLFTQCEPEGFRKITYYQDRPDVMAVFTTHIIADCDRYPLLLSNGNQINRQLLADNCHKVSWHDPFPKPSYLFALVAGQFSQISDEYITRSGRKVSLEVYSIPESINECEHCLASLKRAMAWDEQRFNLEYDLDRYMIVASPDFNMGAMENKGLNIFNTKFVLATSHTATDSDFINVEAVVGHEYFHNWTGNRVTCRDWFQLSLKEGLTVFRDQEFTADLHSRALKRIQDVKLLRQMQFPEDASPLAHPVRPASYIEMNNFYTMTVYEKGAEVVRMYQTLFGRQGFNHGLELYFKRHDGQAVTCDDFAKAMFAANSQLNLNLEQFMLWYSQAGTPRLVVRDSYDELKQEYTLQIQQIIPPTADMEHKQPMLIPLAMGLISTDGHELPVEIIEGSYLKPEKNTVLLIQAEHNKFVFKVATKPTPSLLREFSAPVIIDYPATTTDLIRLACHDSDSFCRFEAIQTVYKQAIKQLYHNPQLSDDSVLAPELISALTTILSQGQLEPQICSLLLSLPSFAELSASFKPVEVDQLVAAINRVQRRLANSLEPVLLSCYQAHQTPVYNLNDSGRRALKNCALNLLLKCDNQRNYQDLVKQQYLTADNMTDRFATLVAINDSDLPLRTSLINQFATDYSAYPLVIDKWLSLQSQSQLSNCLSVVQKLCEHPLYDAKNPNKLYALTRSFSTNPLYFNSANGYKFVANEILRIDQFNPGVASRIAHSFSQVANLAEKYQLLAKPSLELILAAPNLSKDVFELINKTLAELS